MPPTSHARRNPAHAGTASDGNAAGSNVRRTATGRAVRTNTTRPTNYYARPFGSYSAGAGDNASAMDGTHDTAPPGFFPAIQYFSDAVSTVPREVMRQFTLMKEVEAKIHNPNERLDELVDALLEIAPPVRKGLVNGGPPGRGLLSLTASNSANASAVNGVVPRPALGDAQISFGGSVDGGDDGAAIDEEETLAKRRKYSELRVSLFNMLPNLDEKNVVLAEANRVMGLQLLRIDSVMPHLDSEISEDARLGSMSHWAYSDNRQKKQPAGGMHRRDVAATNSLAAAANAIHETEIAQARREAGREATKEKQRGRGRELDSDFDDKPRKLGKAAKNKAALLAATGLGISTNGEPAKRRKVDKGLAAPAMERSASGTAKAAKAARGSPRSTPVIEQGKKMPKAKPAGPPKKKLPGSAQASPMLASSPLASSFNPANVMEPPIARPQSSRQRQPSSTNLRHEQAVDEEVTKVTQAPVKASGNGGKSNGKRKTPEDVQEQFDTAESEPATKTTEREGLKGEDNGEVADLERPPNSRTGSNSGRPGRTANTETPRGDQPSDQASLRKRSGRSRPNGHDSSSSEPQQVSRHKRMPSNSHLVKQLAPFNRSPDLDRHQTNSEDESGSGAGQQEGAVAQERKSERRSISRRNTLSKVAEPEPSPVPSNPPSVADEEDQPMPDVAPPTPVPEDVPELEEEEEEEEEEIPVQASRESPIEEDEPMEGELDEDDESEHDPDDPNEPRYCYCNRGSYGEMVACDNDACPREWFHLGCTELRRAPEESESWFCEDCRPRFAPPPGRRGVGKGRRGG